jgi:hypothetical protein
MLSSRRGGHHVNSRLVSPDDTANDKKLGPACLPTAPPRSKRVGAAMKRHFKLLIVGGIASTGCAAALVLAALASAAGEDSVPSELVVARTKLWWMEMWTKKHCSDDRRKAGW